jgi:F0F1-type ATP synthase assembly protein I
MKEILRSKVNAYGMLVVASLWVLVASISLLVKATGNFSIETDIPYAILTLPMLFVFFNASRKEPGLAGAGLGVGLLSVVTIPSLGDSPFGYAGHLVFLGVSFLLFAFPLIKMDEPHQKLLGLVLVATAIFGIAFVAVNRTQNALSYVFGGLAYLLLVGLAIITVYYIFMESCLNETK